MEAVVVATTLFGTVFGAFLLQKAALEGLFRVLHVYRRAHH